MLESIVISIIRWSLYVHDSPQLLLLKPDGSRHIYRHPNQSFARLRLFCIVFANCFRRIFPLFKPFTDMAAEDVEWMAQKYDGKIKWTSSSTPEWCTTEIWECSSRVGRSHWDNGGRKVQAVQTGGQNKLQCWGENELDSLQSPE